MQYVTPLVLIKVTDDLKICVVTFRRSFTQPKQMQPTIMDWIQIGSLLVNEAIIDKPLFIFYGFVYLTSLPVILYS